MKGREVAEETVKLIQHKLGDRAPQCPMCSNNNWEAADRISMSSTLKPAEGKVNTTNGIPGVVLTCQCCGFNASFNPQTLGIVDL